MTHKTHARALSQAALVFALSSGLGSVALAQNLRVVNGQPIPQSRLQDVLSMAQQPVTPELTKDMTERLIAMEVFSQEAKRRGLQNSDLYQKRMALVQQEVLTQALEAELMKGVTATEAEAKADYDKKVAAASTEYKVRHILVGTDDEKLAKDVIAQLQKGANFADLAKKHSKDPGSAANGGDLGWSSLNSWVPEFADAVSKMAKGGKSTTPVRSQFGWHVIWLEDQRPGKTPQQIPPFKDIKDRVIESLKQQKVGKAMQALRDSAKVQ